MSNIEIIELKNYFRPNQILRIQQAKNGEVFRVVAILRFEQIGTSSTNLGGVGEIFNCKDESGEIYSLKILNFRVLENTYYEVEFTLEK